MKPLIPAVDNGDALGVLIRVGLEHHPVDDAEDRGVDANSEREAGDGDGGEPATLAERAPGIAHILKKHRDLDGLRDEWFQSESASSCQLPASSRRDAP